MSISEKSNLSLLGSSEMKLPISPSEAQLESFENQSPHRPYEVQLVCEDFTSLCPVTGQPDHAAVTITYTPAASCIETKSLKFYLASYRNEAAFNEEIINRILDDLVSACSPIQAEVRGEFAARGGIKLTTTAKHDNK